MFTIKNADALYTSQEDLDLLEQIQRLKWIIHSLRKTRSSNELYKYLLQIETLQFENSQVKDLLAISQTTVLVQAQRIETLEHLTKHLVPCEPGMEVNVLPANN